MFFLIFLFNGYFLVAIIYFVGANSCKMAARCCRKVLSVFKMSAVIALCYSKVWPQLLACGKRLFILFLNLSTYCVNCNAIFLLRTEYDFLFWYIIERSRSLFKTQSAESTPWNCTYYYSIVADFIWLWLIQRPSILLACSNPYDTWCICIQVTSLFSLFCLTSCLLFTYLLELRVRLVDPVCGDIFFCTAFFHVIGGYLLIMNLLAYWR